MELTLAGNVAQDLDGALGVGTVLAGDDLNLLEGELLMCSRERGACKPCLCC